MGGVGLAACALLLLCPLALTRHDDDFAFDNSDEFQVELAANHSEITKHGLRRLWGVPDTSAYVGHLFRMEIPKEAFAGDVLSYKVRSEEGRRMPSWMAIDSKHGLISGVPLEQDLGPHSFTVTAHGSTATASDSFTIEVKKSSEKPLRYGSCGPHERRMVLAILLDTPFYRIAPWQKIKALMELAGFMNLEWDEFWMEPYKSESARDHSVLTSGPGTARARKGAATTAVYLNVGCGEKLWTRHKVLVAGIREQSRDGTLVHLLQQPVIGWRLLAIKPSPRTKRQSANSESSGDYNYDDGGGDEFSGGSYDDDDDDDYDQVGIVPDNESAQNADNRSPPAPHPHRHHHGDELTGLTPLPVSPPTEPTNPTTPTVLTTTKTVETILTTQSVTSTTEKLTTPRSTTESIPPTIPFTSLPSEIPTTSLLPTVLVPLTAIDTTETKEDSTTPASTNAFTTEDHKVKIEAFPTAAGSNKNEAKIDTPLFYSPLNTIPDDVQSTTELDAQTVIIRESNELPSPPPSSSPEPTYAVTSPSTPEVTEVTEVTSPSPPPTTSTSLPTTLPTPTSTFAPILTVAITTASTTQATTQQSTSLPETTIEEVTMQETIPSTSEKSSTIVGRTTETVTMAMPINQPPTLKYHMRKLAVTAGKIFRCIIPAELFTDPEDGSSLEYSLYEADNLPLSSSSWIQFNASAREVYGLPLESHVSRWNFIVEARDSAGAADKGPLDITVQQHKSRRTINHQFTLTFKLQRKFTNALDWQIRALDGIVNLFRDTDLDHLTVLNVTQNDDVCELVWANDTLPRDSCPTDEINRLMKILQSDSESGSPSAGLARVMSPHLKVGHVEWKGVGKCAETPALKPATNSPDPFPPVKRNQVDIITATTGHLLIHKVPEDTFFDPEDGGTRNLHLSLRYSDHSELTSEHWLQFDANNQEFYGLPLANDEGSLQYHLVAEDSSKKTAYDSLIVKVVKAATIRPTVEFQMTMDYPYQSLAYNANVKRKVVERLAALFGDTDAHAIRISSITDNPTTIVWYNTSLPMDRCPKKEIEDLHKLIIDEEKGSTGGALKENVDRIFDKDFKVMSIRLIPLGLCDVSKETIPSTIPAINQPPTLKYHMRKLAVTAGKIFRYIIPAELFTDPEDGSSLEYSLYEADNLPLSSSSWIQFNASAREVYGLPLESHVSRWNFIVEARDSAGAADKGPLDITVQQHKSRRTINHQFTLTFKLQRKFTNALDWQIRALKGIVNLFRDTDLDHLTVLNVTQNDDVCELVWANDTLPRDSCPTDEINRLMKILQSDSESGSPSAGLARVMSPHLKVGHVEWKGVGKCAETPALKPATNSPDPFPPVKRKQVDNITATTGHLLIYKVPEDTFFDPEDGGTRNLHLSLRYSDHSELTSEHWLQFDANNQEFYGLPLANDEGSLQYHLVAEDSSKKTAYDSLIVEVVKAATIRPTVEFQMTMDYPYQSLAYNANVKRKVVEKLAALFGDTDAHAIRISSITDNPTTIVWYNTSLPMDRCPKKEIEDLHKLIIDEEKGSTGGALKENVDRIFDKDFKVMSIRLIPLGLCAEQNTKIKTSVPTHIGTNVQNSKAGTTSTDMFSTEYLVTFIIPAVVIICMIIVAGIIACVLYRRRRTGKMSVGDEEERQAFRSKGIPVIFQDELEEQAAAEPLHKSPVIMREEKPPLLPPAPDYRASAPYRPPPPMSSTTTPPRPKATPTYRKPPPYVPPNSITSS